jgi:Tfp pilus assembly protein PilO
MSKTRQWTVLTAVVVLVIFAAGWLLLVKPQRSHASTLNSQAVTAQQANAQLESQIAALKAEQKNLPEQQRILQKFTTQVPGDPSEPTLIRQLSAAANGSGIDLNSLTPGSPAAVSASTASTLPSTTTTGGLSELPLTINITGTFPNIESFFQSIERLPRATLVTGWTLGSGQASTSSTSTTSTTATDALTGTLSADVFFAGATASATTTPSTQTTTSATPSASPSVSASPAQ